MFRFILYGFLSILALSPMVSGQDPGPVSIEFLSSGARVQGKFFPASDGKPLCTVVLVPGWPGNPRDVLGLGQRLSTQGINVVMFNPRGLHKSEGTASFDNTLADIGAAIQWLTSPATQERFLVDTSKLVLGGHSHGGALSMTYAAWNSSVRSVISIAGGDQAELIRQYQRDSFFAAMLDTVLARTIAPRGPARFDYKASIRELIENEAKHDQRKNAVRLADRSILLFGGWEDRQTTIEQTMLPIYRALRKAGANDVTFIVYHTDHGFTQVTDTLAYDIRVWLVRHFPR